MHVKKEQFWQYATFFSRLSKILSEYICPNRAIPLKIRPTTFCSTWTYLNANCQPSHMYVFKCNPSRLFAPHSRILSAIAGVWTCVKVGTIS